ncbi:mCG18237, isoform CRA_b [Mus musculus]|nr:mCG18237, isoform CRA_b [Mus musculus]
MDARWWAVVVLATLPSLGAGGESPEAPPQSWTQLWLFRFLLNVAGYASFMVPGYLLVQYLRRKNYLETGRGLCFPLVKACVFGNEPKAPDEVLLAPRTETAESTPSWQVLKLVFCASDTVSLSGSGCPETCSQYQAGLKSKRLCLRVLDRVG